MMLQMLNKKMPLHGTIFRQNVPCVNSQKSFSGQHGVGALPWDKVLFFTFQEIQYNIKAPFAKVRGIPPETGNNGEGKRLSKITQSLSKID